ncbi:response regulator transcription factor [Rhizobium sp. BK251]|uniref:response regulator transcription factor n=1 Tax=Rhizobium sp. BK251 TaxID=2512125 RepID=UPI00104496F8|nr:response regulator transcription factor [Rhizobium sp. BK251]TCL74551.1 DNA-binding NarL/FixJ family response regulator [Rhizobium sp. BK251]
MNEGRINNHRIELGTQESKEPSELLLTNVRSRGHQPHKYGENDYVALIDRRTLERQCLAQGLSSHNIGMKVFTFGSLEEWQQARERLGTLRAVLYNAGNGDIAHGSLESEIADMVATFDPAAVIVLSENQELSAVLHAIGLGVRGYIPTSVSIDVCIQAIGLAIAGGKFVPASSVLAMRGLLGVSSTAKPQITSSFTARQSAVAEALRRGKANKVIASELDLCESTVKVHIRNIMKKLGATNRTEVAYKIGDMISDQPHA